MMSKDRKLGMKAKERIGNVFVYMLLIIMSIIWLTPFVCIVLQSFRVESTWQDEQRYTCQIQTFLVVLLFH